MKEYKPHSPGPELFSDPETPKGHIPAYGLRNWLYSLGYGLAGGVWIALSAPKTDPSNVPHSLLSAWLPGDISAWGLLLGSAVAFHLLMRRLQLMPSIAEITALRALSNTNELRVQSIVSAVADGIVITDTKGVICGYNPAAELIFGFTEDEALGQSINLLMPEDVAAHHDKFISQYLKTRRGTAIGFARELRARRKDGTVFPIELSLSELRDGEKHQFISVVRDITERKNFESRLVVAEKVLEATSEGVMVTDRRGTMVWVNNAFSRISGYAREEVEGQNASIMKSGLQGPEFYGMMWAQLHSEGEWQGEIWNRRKNGEAFPEWLTIKAIQNEDGLPTRFVGVFSDISKHKRAEEQIRNLTYYDPATQLPNAHLFCDRLAQALERARRRERRVAVVMVSLDRFKTVNETLGHQIGDALLRQVADRLSASMRSQDTVARLRGDIFCCMLTDLLSEHDAPAIIGRLLDDLLPSFSIETHELYVATSIGISVFPLDGTEIDDLLQKAETAMNRCKAERDSKFQFYTPEMNANSVERLRLETDLRKALEQGDMELFYQPKVKATTGELVGTEALLRWRHPVMGYISPAHFVPIAEDTGLIVPISAFVLKTACEQLAKWRDEGLTPVRTAINLSPQQFKHGDIVGEIDAALEHAGIPPEFLEVELTETSVMQDADGATKILNNLHLRGIHVAIDDFGTGYSSLSYLRRFPLDRLKIDRSFVQELGGDSASEEIVGAIIAMAHSLNLTVVAEGVETDLQLEKLQSLSCDEIQGFYFSPAVPAAAFGDFLRSRVLTKAC